MDIFLLPPTPAEPRLAAYEYVARLSRSRLAWEYLRRNPGYIQDWRRATPRHPGPRRLSDGTLLLRPRQKERRAPDWGLCHFRRSR